MAHEDTLSNLAQRSSATFSTNGRAREVLNGSVSVEAASTLEFATGCKIELAITANQGGQTDEDDKPRLA